MKNSKHDWADNSGFRQFAKEWLKDVAPKIRDSAFTITIAPTGGTVDVKIAVEIGYSILLDKPLIVFCPKGRVVAPKLLRIADHIVEGDFDTEAGRKAMNDKLNAILDQ
jgi:hypothetical protein